MGWEFQQRQLHPHDDTILDLTRCRAGSWLALAQGVIKGFQRIIGQGGDIAVVFGGFPRAMRTSAAFRAAGPWVFSTQSR
ncbi:hypothetical protein D7X32_15130 [Corallococcus carmarthensis]|uniref:Uncharacterized protein n=1 Tax=Corallococcus carmarthensis TaxID=2316728 RepID=A0A3A8K6Y6_9BACT|nr:hypothetical protein D7X32_15130 [Corallococcus carmarthensis]